MEGNIQWDEIPRKKISTVQRKERVYGQGNVAEEETEVNGQGNVAEEDTTTPKWVLEQMEKYEGYDANEIMEVKELKARTLAAGPKKGVNCLFIDTKGKHHDLELKDWANGLVLTKGWGNVIKKEAFEIAEKYPLWSFRSRNNDDKLCFTLVKPDQVDPIEALPNVDNEEDAKLSDKEKEEVANKNDTEASSFGCCQNSVPKRSKRFRIRSRRFDRETSVSDFKPCFYAFLVDEGRFDFSPSQDLQNLRNVTKFPVVLDWSIGGQTCQQVGNTSICGHNSVCTDSTTRTGYNCKCKAGYDGNPYLPEGCRDIDECTNSSPIHRHNCSGSSICVNTMGHFLCIFPSGFDLNATTNGCMRKHKPENHGWIQIVLGTTVGFFAILLVFICVQHKIKHMKNIELRKHFFDQNGGGMLRQRLSGAGPSNADVKIFTEESMKRATNGYEESRILGQGGQGTVYKGILPDSSVVAIKKARLGDSSQVEQFINEVLVLSQINHKNVVNLLGCCLETEVPLLVYEFINSGTLYDRLHGPISDSSLTREHRLRIAVEIAGTHAYLHSSASVPIIHRDVKTANILLDENLTAKVADFGASRLIPMDKEQLTTMVQGTLGYLDPEYYNTGLLNEKSDVYSFGVVLMELLTGQKALCLKTTTNTLHEVIDGQVLNESNQREIHEAARIAVECTRLMGEERPGMKEVAAQLEALRVTKTKHEWSDQYNEPEGNEHLVGVEMLSAQGDTSTAGYDSIKNEKGNNRRWQVFSTRQTMSLLKIFQEDGDNYLSSKTFQTSLVLYQHTVHILRTKELNIQISDE
ncbi:hypothetical protein Bca101_081160 [Brassica carinata]